MKAHLVMLMRDFCFEKDGVAVDLQQRCLHCTPLCLILRRDENVWATHIADAFKAIDAFEPIRRC